MDTNILKQAIQWQVMQFTDICSNPSQTQAEMATHPSSKQNGQGHSASYVAKNNYRVTILNKSSSTNKMSYCFKP